MNVLVIGGGGREHAICHCLARSSRRPNLFILPGNAGTASLGQNIDGDAEDIDFALRTAEKYAIDLTIVGPEDPLAAGIVDRFEAAGRRVFGPCAAAARLEADKSFAKQIMRQWGVPTADARVFGPTEQEKLYARHGGARDDGFTGRPLQTGYGLACEYVSTRDEPLVVKASGLAKGKGVFVCDTPSDALLALERLMIKREFGAAGDTVVVEERLIGRECSVMALVDGRTIYILEPAQDYKRLNDGDAGPNTGGMGSYCPSDIDDALMRQIESQIIVPVIHGLLHDGIPYRGVLYAGLMLTAGGPRVLEFNCRFGDPETQAVLMRLRTDLLDVLEAVVDGKLDTLTLEWDTRPSVCVVMSAGGYPGTARKGQRISGLGNVAAASDVAAFHAGTKLERGDVVTAGGRVLSVAAIGSDMSIARRKAYDVVDRIQFDGAHFRRDIGADATGGETSEGQT